MFILQLIFFFYYNKSKQWKFYSSREKNEIKKIKKVIINSVLLTDIECKTLFLISIFLENVVLNRYIKITNYYERATNWFSIFQRIIFIILICFYF